MSTKEQISANRKNAKKSTGPKTTQGKETSSQNATKHGFFAQQDVIKHESQADYDILRGEILQDLNPIGTMQRILAERIISLTWRLERTVRMHNQTIDVRLKRERSDCDLALGRMANNDFVNYRVLDKLIMYERRIENSLYKTMREMKKLQKEKAKNEPNYHPVRRTPGIGPFYLPDRNNNLDTPEHIHQKMQNEPNSQDKMSISEDIAKDYESKLHGPAPSAIQSIALSVIPTESSEPRDLLKNHQAMPDS
jgi:hypothetical protein